MRWTALSILVVVTALQGCAAFGLTVVGAGAGGSAAAATEYTLNGTAYRTFTASSAPVHQATRAALTQMGMTVKTDERTAEGHALAALAGEREVEIELLALTPKATQMRVTVKNGVFWRDRSTAGEIITQAGTALDRSAALARKRAAPKNGEAKGGEPKPVEPKNKDEKAAAPRNGAPKVDRAVLSEMFPLVP